MEYYTEALFEAVVFCMTKGIPDEYISSLDVYGFGEVFKYIKRIDTRERITELGNMRASQSEKKDYKKYLASLEVWLPSVEIGKNSSTESKKTFDNLVKKGMF